MTEQIKKEMSAVTDNSAAAVTDDEMALINAYSRRTLTKDEVYVFGVVLCDNDIDRDNERFTVESLFELEKLFVGKTGIFDHSPTAKNQTARIFACSVESVGGRKTANGDDYFRLTARAYIPKTKGNEEIIQAIDSGILKEVSIGCAAGEVRCGICGENINHCAHIKGETYGGKLCCGELTNIYDAYEWSFVAVPAQRNAGVTKNFKGKEMKMEEILKSIYTKREINLSGDDCKKLCSYIDELKKSAADGAYYRNSLTSEVLRLSAVVQPDISRETMESVAKGMSVVQLKEFKNAFEKRADSILPSVPQLYKQKNDITADSNGNFKI
ncbi:hypothetical protein [Ruminococcus sp.]|uniref:hypothetical protein n=1 Tax=Ruminococcus sp. TaxID=41978 RepID=UPI003F803DFF